MTMEVATNSREPFPDDNDEIGILDCSLPSSLKVPSPSTLTVIESEAVPNTSAGIEKLVLMLSAKENELRQLQKTHDEYVKSSCDYEKELESEVDRFEKKILHLELQLQSLEDAKRQLQTALAQAQNDLAGTHRREEAAQVQNHEMKWKIQRLEQSNDELETANRISQASIEELQHKLDTLTEENVFLLQEREEVAVASRRPSDSKDSVPETFKALEAAQLNLVTTTVSQTTWANASADDRSLRTLTRKVSDASGPEPANRKSKRKSGRYPEVVETCLHMTCTNCQCRRNSHHHNASDKSLGKLKKKGGFLDRIRRKFLRA